MNLINRYIFGQIMIPFVMCTVIMTAIAWLTQASRLLDLIILRGQGADVFFRLTLLLIPGLVGLIAPIGLLISCIYTLNRLNQDSELSVIYASGSGKWQIVYPFIVASLLVSCFVFAIGAYFMPLSLHKLRGETAKIRADLIANLLQPGQFLSPVRNVTIYFRERDRNGDMMGIIIHDSRKKEEQLSITAKRGKLVSNDRGDFMFFFEGNIQHKKVEATEVKIVAFTQYAYDLAELSPEAKVSYYKPKERFIGELFNPDPTDPFFRSQPQKVRSELHRRLISPFYPFVFTLICLAFLANAHTARQGQVIRIIQTIAIVVLVRGIGLAMVNLSGKKDWAIAIAYGLPLATILICAYVIMKNRQMVLPKFIRNRISLPDLFLAGKTK